MLPLIFGLEVIVHLGVVRWFFIILLSLSGLGLGELSILFFKAFVVSLEFADFFRVTTPATTFASTFAITLPSITTSSILGGTIGQIQLALFGLAISNSICMPVLIAEVAFFVLLEVDLITWLAHPVIGLVLDLFTAPADSGVSSDISCHANSSLASCAVVLQQELPSRFNADWITPPRYTVLPQ